MNLGKYPLVTHIGAGDGILQTGLAVGLLDRYEEIAFPCYPQYESTFKSIFISEPRISIYTVPRIEGEDWGSPRDHTYDAAIESAGLRGRPHIRAGIYAGRGIGWDFSKSFYEHVDLPYEYRWRRCPIRSVSFLADPIRIPVWDPKHTNRRIFIHEDPSRNFNAHRAPRSGDVFSPDAKDIGVSMLSYARIINTADEIHCIDSAFFHLVDSLDPVGKLYLHCYARWPRGRDFRYENRFMWNYLF